jgi:hypothetical protein
MRLSRAALLRIVIIDSFQLIKPFFFSLVISRVRQEANHHVAKVQAARGTRETIPEGSSRSEYQNDIQKYEANNAGRRYVYRRKVTGQEIGLRGPRSPRQAGIAPAKYGTHRSPSPKSGQAVMRFQKVPKLKADIDGKAIVGIIVHSHIEPHTRFTRLWNRSLPNDSPGETDDRFLDVTKRYSKDTEEMKSKMLKRSIPGGSPPQIPVRTTRGLRTWRAF